MASELSQHHFFNLKLTDQLINQKSTVIYAFF